MGASAPTDCHTDAFGVVALVIGEIAVAVHPFLAGRMECKHFAVEKKKKRDALCVFVLFWGVILLPFFYLTM